MKVLNLLLAAAMVSSTFVMPVSAQTASAAETVENVIYETDFDDISSLGDLPYDAGAKTGWGYFYGKTGDKYGFEDSKYIDLVDEDGNKYLYTYQTAEQNGAENALYYDTSKITSGSIVADYDIKFDRENLTNMRIGYGMRADNMITSTGEVYNGYYRGGADKISVAPAETIKADTWYHVTMTADFDNDTMHLVMTDRDTQEEAVNEQLTGFTSGGETRALGINTIEYASGGSEKQGAYLDNVKITHVTEAAEPDPAPTPTQTADPAGPAALPFNETFDYDSIEEMTAAGWVFKGAGSEENISKIEDGVLKLGLAKGINNRRAQRVLTPITSGILTAEWDVTPAEGVSTYTYFWGNGNNGKPGTLNSNIPVMYFDNGAKNIHFNANGTGGANIGAYTPGQTYHCKAEADFDNSLLTVTVTDSSGAPVGTHSGTVGYNEIREITFQIWAEPANDTWVGIDNVSITHKERTPETLPLIENFDYADINEMKANGWSAVDTNNDISKIEDGVFKLGLKAGVNNQQYVRNIEEVSSGILKIEYDVTPVEGVCAYLWTGSARTPVFYFYDGKIRVASTNTEASVIGSYENGKTYHCSATLYLEEDKIAAEVKQGDNVIASGERTGVNSTVNQIVLQTWASPASDTWVSFDNLTVTHEAGEPVPTPTSDPAGPAALPFSETFDYDSIEAMEATGWWFETGDRLQPVPNISKLEDGMLKVGLAKGADNQQAKRLFAPVTSGVLTIELDVVPSDYTNSIVKLWGNSSTSVFPVYFHNDNKISVNGTPGTVIGDYTPGKTYHCKLVVNLDSKNIDVTVTGTETGTLAKGSFPYEAKRLEELTLQTWQNDEFTNGDVAESFVGFDNITIEHGTEPEPTPTSDPSFEEVIYENDFDSVENLNDLDGKEGDGWNRDVGGRKPGLGTDGEIMLLEDGENKYLYVNHTTDTLKLGDTVAMSYDYPAVTTGQVIYDFDIMTDRTNMAFMRYGYAAHMDNSIMPNGEIYNSYWTNDKKKLTDNLIMPEKWYHVVITADLTSDYSTLYIEDKETGDKIVDVDIPGIGNHNLTRFEIAITDQAKENIGGAYLDNLKITRTTKPATDPRPMPEPAFKFEENFDLYDDLDAMKANGWNVFSGYSTSRPGPNSEESAIIGDGTDKSFYLGIDANTDNIQAKKSFGTSIGHGRALMEFDIIPGADTVTYIWMDGTGEGTNSGIWSAGGFSLFVFTTDGRVGVGASRFNEAQFLANYTAGEKYHCSIIIDIENDTFTAEIENEDGTLLGSKTISYKELAGTDIYTLTGLTLQEWTASANTGSIFDNIVITKLPENTPVASIANTTFIADGEESSNYKEVSTLTDTIAVNFGAVMDLETLEGIKIVNSADSSEIAYTAEISGNSVNLNLAEALAPNAEYAIVIPAEAANIDGVVLGEETRLVFNTKDDASYSGAIKALTIDGNAVTNLSQIKAGTTLTADVKLDNATAEDKKAVVIFSFYNESGALVKTNYEVIDLKAGAKFDDAVEYTVEDMTDVAAAKVMLWDGFRGMRALDGCTTID